MRTDTFTNPRPSSEPERGSTAASLLERGVFACLLLFAVSAPHSIAAAQISWGVGLALWAARLCVRPRKKLWRTPVDYALLGFFILTFISSLFSYDPDVSIGKMRAASLFTIVYLTTENIPTRRTLRVLAFALVGSCVVNVVYTFGAFAVGHGVKVEGLSAQSPLYAAGLRDGDTLLEIEGATPRDAAGVERAIREARAAGRARVPALDWGAACVSTEREACARVYRAELLITSTIERAKLLPGETPEARLGIARWSRGRDERARGFYGHYTTYAEVLQLIASLALGLVVAHGRRRGWAGALLLVATAGMTGALLLTLTRASWLGFLLSALTVVVVGARRRALFVMAAIALPLAVCALLVLQEKRRVGFLDRADASTTWRATVWREGFGVLTREPRHLAVGVGMDSLKRHWREWGMFDGGRLPVGHLHSTPLQLAFERGVPALAVWLALLFFYARTLWRTARRRSAADDDDDQGGGGEDGWLARGVALGGLGGLVGFFSSGMVHYNLGDSEVAMVFYFIMGLALAASRLLGGRPRSRRGPAAGGW